MAYKFTHHFFILFYHTIFVAHSFQALSNVHTICNNTLYPSYCISILEDFQLHDGTIRTYGSFCINKSLSMANNFSLMVSRYLQKYESVSSQTTRYALQDCMYLANLSTTHITTTIDVMRLVNTWSMFEVNRVQTLLNAMITNVETCYSGLLEARPKSSLVTKGLTPEISNYTMLLCVTLALFDMGWAKSTKEPFCLNSENCPTTSSKLEIGDLTIRINSMVVVNSDGTGDFTTINEAVTAAPNNTKPGGGYFGIHVIGTFEEYVDIPSSKPYLLMVGDGIDHTIISGNRSKATNFTTFSSATFAVSGTGFVAVNMTFRNTAGPTKGQAVAVRNGADLSAFYRCGFDGYQDTLLAFSMKQFYKECNINGTIDFIFGNAAAVFQDCNIYVKQPLEGQSNVITAQGRNKLKDNVGFSIQKCKIMANDDLIKSNISVKTYLGRPWRKYSRTIYMQSFMDSLIDPSGWLEWEGSYAPLDTLYYAEFDNSGPGSSTTNRVNWSGYHVIDETTASYFTVKYFILGDFWLPSTGVPYIPGLDAKNQFGNSTNLSSPISSAG